MQSLEKVIDANDLKSTSVWRPVEVDPEQPAFLRFPPAPRWIPKAVIVSHVDLMHNLAMMESALAPHEQHSEAENGAVCWLPLYHDMGLVGCLYLGLYYPATVTYLGPETFIARPSRGCKPSPATGAQSLPRRTSLMDSVSRRSATGTWKA